MKILLVTPINRTYVVMPSLGLGYLASVVKKRHSVSILDCKKEKMTYADFSAYISENDFDLIGFQLFSYDVNAVKRHIEIIRGIRNKKRVPIVAGGPHPSGLPDKIFDCLPELDFAFRGESERGFAEFTDLLDTFGSEHIQTKHEELGRVPGLIFRGADGRVSVNEPGFVDNLDSIDFPDWELLDPSSYPEAPHGAFARSFPTAPIIITRGCPFLCTFCAGKAISGSKIRKRSIDNVWAEIQYLTKRFGIKEILIEDENFTLHKDLLNEFCVKLLNSGKKISWSFPSGVRLDTLDAENLKLMEEAGCYSFGVGIEFGSQRIHDLTKKNMSLGLIEEKIALISKTRIKTTGFFLMGIPGETKEDLSATIRLALKLDIDRAQFNNFIPLPGSELWNSLNNTNRLKNINWDRFYVHDTACCLNGITPEELKSLQRQAYFRFYLRPKKIGAILKEIKSFRHFKLLLNRFKDAIT